MKVLFFLSDLDGGGAQRTIVNLANKMSELGMHPTLVVARGGGPAQNWLNEHIPLVELGVNRTRYAVMGLRKELLRSQPDVLFATMVDANIVATLASIGLRRQMQLILRETNSHRARGDIQGVRRTLIGWAYRRADAVVALSSGVRKELLSDYQLDDGKVVTIGNPVDVEKLAAARQAAIRNTRPFPTGEPVVIAVGRLTHQKGFDILIKAFAQIKHSAKLVILGEGPDRGRLIDLAEEEEIVDRLIMPGFVPDPAAWLAHADVFVLSSRWEGFGHVIVEAMAAQVPVIATDCPYGPADIIKNGHNGLLVKEGDPSAMAAAIEELLENKEKAADFKWAAIVDIKKFDVKEIVNQYSNLFHCNQLCNVQITQI